MVKEQRFIYRYVNDILMLMNGLPKDIFKFKKEGGTVCPPNGPK